MEAMAHLARGFVMIYLFKMVIFPVCYVQKPEGTMGT